VLALSSAPSSLDPRFATDANGMRIIDLLFNSLVKVGPQLQIVGDAAESWTYEKLTYSFRLRPGLEFSDNSPLTAEDIRFSFDEYRKSSNPFSSSLKSIDRVEVLEDELGFLVKLHLKEYSAKLLVSDLPAIKLLSRAAVLRESPAFSESFIGTGSFKMNKQSDTEIIIEGRPGHKWAPPKVSRVVFKIIRDDLTRYQKMLRGDLDIVQNDMPLNKVKIFQEKPNEYQVFRFPGLSMTYLLFNLEDPLLKQKSLRTAIAHGINREEIIKYKLEGFAHPASSILTPENPYFNQKLSNPPLDVEKAREITSTIGIQQKPLIIKTANNPSTIDHARVLAYQINNIGLKAELQSYEWGTFYGDIRKGKFQMAIMRWIGALDPDIYRIAFHSSEIPPGRNRGRYLNPKLDQLLEQGLKEADKEARVRLYQKVQQIVSHDLPIIPLWYDEQVAIVNKRVRNYEPSMNGDFSPLIYLTKQ
ncbi:MAG: ABC transporter substrate-binding protein, partial [Bdellovibrionales bacterium]|nr:ABC transporter substrate-binding protein [Bdellovibrionales bacterium]